MALFDPVGSSPLISCFLALLLAATLVRPAASDPPPPRGSIIVGVNRTNLAWEGNSVRRATIDAIKDAGIDSVRVSWREPRKHMTDILVEAAKRDLALLIEIPLTQLLAKPDTSARPGAGPLGPRARLSDIDPDAFESYFAAAFADLERAKVRVSGFQIGNEVNWADFNGDFPLLATGVSWSAIDDVPAPHRQHIEKGFRVYAELVQRAHKLRDQSPRFREVPIITAGLADVGESWARKTGGTLVSRDAALRMLSALGVFQNVEGVGLHIYQPFLSGRNLAKELDVRLSGCGATPTGRRPCWVTEFGSSATVHGCDTQDGQRRDKIEAFAAIIDRLGAGIVRGAFVFDWDKAGGWSVVRCGRLTDAGRSFASWARHATTGSGHE